MNSTVLHGRASIRSLSISLIVCLFCFACGQDSMSQESGASVLVVEGRVSDVFRSASSENRYLVKILVQKSEVARIDQMQGATRFPAPGEFVFVAVEEKTRNRRALDSSGLPRPNMFIRATLSAGEHQQWQGDSPNWYREVSGSATAESGSSTKSILGIETVAVNSASVRGVKVTSVAPSTAAANAGIEVGDVLVKVNGVEIDSPAKLDEQAEKSVRLLKRSLQLTVRDVRTGRDVPVEVALNNRNMAERGARRSLGVTTELAFFGGNPALKIVKVADGSPSKRAGLKTGWLILAADGRAVGKPAMLTQAEQDAGNEMVLKVVDPKTREQRELRVNLR